MARAIRVLALLGAYVVLLVACSPRAPLTAKDRREILSEVVRVVKSDPSLGHEAQPANSQGIVVSADSLDRTWLEAAPISGIRLLTDEELRREAAASGRVCWLRLDEIKELESGRLEIWVWSDCAEAVVDRAGATLSGAGAQLEASRLFGRWRVRVLSRVIA